MWKRLEGKGDRSGWFWKLLDWLAFWTVFTVIFVLLVGVLV